MRVESILFLVLLLGAILVFVRSVKTIDDDEDEQIEENRSSSTTKRPKRVKKKPKVKISEYPKCHTETIDDRPAYMCERKVDGEKQKFGITFRDDGIRCGQYRYGQLNGLGSVFYMADEYDRKVYCGHFVDDKLNGSVSWYFFNTESIELGGMTEMGQEGTALVYVASDNSINRNWYRTNDCRSQIIYDENGEEYYRNAYHCQ